MAAGLGFGAASEAAKKTLGLSVPSVSGRVNFKQEKNQYRYMKTIT